MHDSDLLTSLDEQRRLACPHVDDETGWDLGRAVRDVAQVRSIRVRSSFGVTVRDCSLRRCPDHPRITMPGCSGSQPWSTVSLIRRTTWGARFDRRVTSISMSLSDGILGATRPTAAPSRHSSREVVVSVASPCPASHRETTVAPSSSGATLPGRVRRRRMRRPPAP
jgi:hypothetical protein